MSKPTHKTYPIRRLQDVVETVPIDRVAECMRELGEVVYAAACMRELAIHILTEKGVPIPDAGLYDLPETIEWIDNGKGEVELLQRVIDDPDKPVEALLKFTVEGGVS